LLAICHVWIILPLMQLVIELIGWTGMLLYVAAYALVSSGRTSGVSPKFQLMNLIGAVGVATNAVYYGAYPSAAVNVVWFFIAAATLLKVFMGRDPA
jgi:hypothetical protein